MTSGTIPKLTSKGVDALYSFTRQHRNAVVESFVRKALLEELNEEDLNQQKWNIRRDVSSSLAVYHSKIQTLSQIRSRLPQQKGDDVYVKLITQLFKRTPSDAVVSQLVQLQSRGKRQIDVVNEYGLKTSNLNRLLQRYKDTETLAKEAIIAIFILPD